jgi:hypothetical protein
MYSLQDIITNKINTEGHPSFPKPKVPIRHSKAEKDWEATVILSECFPQHYVLNRYQQAVPKKRKDWRQRLAEELRKEFGWVANNAGQGMTEEQKERERDKVRKQAAARDDAITIERVTRNLDEMEGVIQEKRENDSTGLAEEIDDRLKFKDQQHRQKGPIKRRRIRTTDPRLKKQKEEELQPEHYASSKRRAARVEDEDEDSMLDDDEDLKRKRNPVPTEEEIEAAWESTMRNAPVESDSEEEIRMPEAGEDPAVLVDLIESEEESEDELNDEGEVKPKLRTAYDGYETFWKTICLIITKTDQGKEYTEHQREVGKQVELMLMNMPNLNDNLPKDLWEEFGDFDLVTQDGRVIRDDLRREEPSDDEEDL